MKFSQSHLSRAEAAEIHARVVAIFSCQSWANVFTMFFHYCWVKWGASEVTTRTAGARTWSHRRRWSRKSVETIVAFRCFTFWGLWSLTSHAATELIEKVVDVLGAEGVARSAVDGASARWRWSEAVGRSRSHGT